MFDHLECANCHQRTVFVREPDPENPFLSVLGGTSPCVHCGTNNFHSGTARRTDFKFSFVSGILRADYAKEKPICIALQVAHKAFLSNMDRVTAFGRFPQLIQFQYEYFLRHFDFGPDGDALAPKEESKPFLEKGAFVEIKPKDVDPRLAYVSCEGMEMALEGLLSSMIIGTWTAFETLAGDLWEAALNAAPKRLSLLRGEARRIELKTGTKARKQQDPVEQANQAAEAISDPEEGETADRAVSLNLMQRLTRGTFDLSHLMGTLQREQIDFDSLKDIREAYSRAFYKPISEDIDQSLADRRLDSLQHVRNLLVHRAGIADQKYARRAKKLPGAPILEESQRIKLTGSLVSDLIKPVIESSLRLIAGVDERTNAEVSKHG